jgi:hypothetical protein
MIKLFRRLKNKWGIENNWQFFLINVIFAITGSLTVFIRKPVFHLLAISAETPFVIKFFVYILVVTPVYFILLIIVGTLLGQFRFFWNFEKKIFSRFKRTNIRKNQKAARKY